MYITFISSRNLILIAILTVGIPVQSQTVSHAFAGYYGLNPLSDGASNADPDRDGFPNLLEVLLGGDPTVPKLNIRPTLTSTTVGGGQNLIFSYNRKIGASSLVTQVVEHSSGVSLSWTPAVSGLNGVTISNSTVDVGTERVAVTIPVTSAQRFVRLRVAPLVPMTPPSGFSFIPAGSFAMGDLKSDSPLAVEKPVHTVYLSAYFMGINEVTKSYWDEVRTWGLSNGYTSLTAGGGKASNHPVHSVSWYDAVKWCNAASEKAGLNPCYKVSNTIYRTGESAPTIDYAANGYRLPTEAEWEKAARGGLTGVRFPWGDTITHSKANYISQISVIYDISPTRSYHPTFGTGVVPWTSPVGSFQQNGYGLYDLSGNVMEWCSDWWGSNYYSSSSSSDPKGPSTGTYRSIRGGHWSSVADNCRVAARNTAAPVARTDNCGFRLARTFVP